MDFLFSFYVFPECMLLAIALLAFILLWINWLQLLFYTVQFHSGNLLFIFIQSLAKGVPSYYC